jgi:hypothetical protein
MQHEAFPLLPPSFVDLLPRFQIFSLMKAFLVGAICLHFEICVCVCAFVGWFFFCIFDTVIISSLFFSLFFLLCFPRHAVQKQS